MAIQYITNINDTEKKETLLLLIDCSIQAYNAFSDKHPATCQVKNITLPSGYDFVECWTGIDAFYGHDKSVEIYGVVFRTKVAPYTYIFAFRGTTSIYDVIDDLGVDSKSFIPYKQGISVSPEIKVESGFFDVYSTCDAKTPSMQSQLFQLIDTYQKSDKPIHQLYITGHSLGAALSELFTLDIALSRPTITASNINYACPRIGNCHFVTCYEKQPLQQNAATRTLRVQNTYDKVPCVPPEDIGYQHLSYAYLIAFYEVGGIFDHFNLVARHAADNYQAVLKCAAMSDTGVCINEKLVVKTNNETVSSKEPDPKSICNLW